MIAESALRRLSVTTVGLLLFWQSVILTTKTPTYILPSPLAVVKRLWVSRSELLANTGVTAIEIFLGLLLAAVFATFTALCLQYSPRLRRWFQPLMLVSQAIPVYALGPILMLWFGYGLTPKVIITVIIVYFPIATAAYDGLRRTPAAYLRLARTMNASTWRILWHIRLPAALPSFASGMRVAAAIAPIGAIIGEYVGGSNGLGYLMQYGLNRSLTDLAFAALFVITLLTLAIYYGIDAVLRKMINW